VVNKNPTKLQTLLLNYLEILVSRNCINISLDIGAKRLRCGWIFIDHSIANSLLSVSVKILKIVQYLMRYEKKVAGLFGPTCRDLIQ